MALKLFVYISCDSILEFDRLVRTPGCHQVTIGRECDENHQIRMIFSKHMTLERFMYSALHNFPEADCVTTRSRC